jgi:hypothetical protein
VPTTFALATIMDAIAATLVAEGVTTAPQTYAYPVPAFSPPCAVVGYPRPGAIDLDLTFKRGGIEAVFPVWIVVGKTIDIDARNALSALLDGGATTVKTALESGLGTLGGVVASTQVKSPAVEVIHDGQGTEYLAARFDVEVVV